MSARHVLLTEAELEQLEEIDRLLDEAHAHALERDGHCKSSEGWVRVSFGNHWDRREETRHPREVEIYSYLLSSHRNHSFDSIEQALKVVRVWHRNEMARTDTDEYLERPLRPILGEVDENPYDEIDRVRRESYQEEFRKMDQFMATYGGGFTEEDEG